MSACERYEEMISALLDGELSADEEAALRAHLAECPDCAAMYDAFAAVGEAIRGQDVPDTLHEGIMDQVRAAEKAGRTQHRIIRLRPILAAAACLVVVVGTVFALRNNAGFGRGAMKSADAAAPMAPESFAAAGSNGGAAADAADMALPEEALFDSKVAAADFPASGATATNSAVNEAEMPKEAGTQADQRSTEEKFATDGIASDVLCFTIRLEALTEQGLIGVVTDPGDQTLIAEGARVTVLTDDGADLEQQSPGTRLSVIISSDEQLTDDGAVHALTIAPAE